MTWIGHRRTDTEITYRQIDGHKKVKILKTNTPAVNAGPPDREYLHYPLDVEGVTLNGSLLPALR